MRRCMTRCEALRASSDKPAVQIAMLHLMGDFSDPALVTRTLDTIAAGKVRNQDSAALLATMLRNRDTQAADVELHPESLGCDPRAVHDHLGQLRRTRGGQLLLDREA